MLAWSLKTWWRALTSTFWQSGHGRRLCSDKLVTGAPQCFQSWCGGGGVVGGRMGVGGEVNENFYQDNDDDNDHDNKGVSGFKVCDKWAMTGCLGWRPIANPETPKPNRNSEPPYSLVIVIIKILIIIMIIFENKNFVVIVIPILISIQKRIKKWKTNKKTWQKTNTKKSWKTKEENKNHEKYKWPKITHNKTFFGVKKKWDAWRSERDLQPGFRFWFSLLFLFLFLLLFFFTFLTSVAARFLVTFLSKNIFWSLFGRYSLEASFFLLIFWNYFLLSFFVWFFHFFLHFSSVFFVSFLFFV